MGALSTFKGGASVLASRIYILFGSPDPSRSPTLQLMIG
jgi:hypothetical protein